MRKKLELEHRLLPGVDVQDQVVTRAQAILRGEHGQLAGVVGRLPGKWRDPARARGCAQRAAVLQRIVRARRRARRASGNRSTWGRAKVWLGSSRGIVTL